MQRRSLVATALVVASMPLLLARSRAGGTSHLTTTQASVFPFALDDGVDPVELRAVEPKPAETTTSTTEEPTTTTEPPVTTPVTRPVTKTPSVQVTGPPAPVQGDVWAALRQCESTGNYQDNTGNGFYGAYQFTASTWDSMGTGYARADLAPPAVQDDAAQRLQARSGWGQWPACSRSLGLR